MNAKGHLEIHAPEGIAERRLLDESRLTVGTGRDADVRLDASSGLLPHHLTLVPLEEGVLVEVVEEAPSGVYFAGREQRSVRVPWGEEAYLGGIRLSFVRKKAKARAVGPVGLVAGLFAFALLGAVSIQAFLPPAASARAVEPPELGANAGVCHVSDQAVIEHRARETERAAKAKQERFAFAPSEGVPALRLYQESRECFTRMGRTEDATRVAKELESWLGRMNEEYASLRLRLRVALDQKRVADALAATIELESLLTPHFEGPYVEWLSSLRRELERKTAKTGS